MMITWVLAAVLAEVPGETTHQSEQSEPLNQAKPATQTLLLPLSGTSMTCTKEGDQLVCVIPLEKQLVDELQPTAIPIPKVAVHRPSTPTLVLPGPEVFAKVKAAEANIELAKSLLPKATSPEEAVLAQQLLYRAKEQYRTARALLHTVEGDLRRAPDPFDGDSTEAVAVCEDVASPIEDACEPHAP